MNKIVRDILLFAAGFGAGALVMHTVFEKKYETYYGERYEAERENLRQAAEGSRYGQDHRGKGDPEEL